MLFGKYRAFCSKQAVLIFDLHVEIKAASLICTDDGERDFFINHHKDPLRSPLHLSHAIAECPDMYGYMLHICIFPVSSM